MQYREMVLDRFEYVRIYVCVYIVIYHEIPVNVRF